MPAAARDALLTSDLPFPVRRGKVRDVYDLGDALLIVASDRISAFDCVMPNPIPGKGKILTALSLFWFGKFAQAFENLEREFAPLGQLRAAARASADGRFDQRIARRGVDFLHELPGVTIGDTQLACGGADAVNPRDRRQKLGAALAEHGLAVAFHPHAHADLPGR